ncbi:protein croquemort-like isoform X2 [Venturia canescens]|uniref:protein croquemort-like isoform X2 n=1 Tax=Venturia canescens TaxID=32260 RepID=UPI001C9C1329|nr:protein croquemort-like isoform X2 [Venturia canescens]
MEMSPMLPETKPITCLTSNHSPSPPPKKMRGLTAVMIVSATGLVAMVVGLAVGLLWTTIFHNILIQQLTLTPTSKSYSLWKETPLPMYLKLHLFNWTNPEDFYVSSKIKPHFVEMGPYVFKEVDSKENQVWNDNNNTVTFQQKRVWHFVESMSNGSLSDQVTNLNPVATTIAYMMRYKIDMIKMLINSGMRAAHENLTVTKTVEELLFNGYDDRMLKWATKLNKSLVPFDKFGWFYQRNNSAPYDGTFNMLTGHGNIHDLGVLKEWNYSNKSKFHSSTCGEISGSLGDLWGPVKDAETLQFFAPDVCTSMNLVFNNLTEHSGITGREYISNREMLDNGTLVESRKCYCDGIECIPSGAFNVSKCKFGAPAFISLPHFYLADESYRSAIDGMEPHEEKHRFSITIEPKTGIPMQVRGKLQLNLLIQPDKFIEIFKNVPRTFVPMLWFSQEADLTSSLASQVKFVLILPLLGQVTLYGIAAIGFLLLAIGTGIYIRRTRRGDDGQSLIPKVESNGGERTIG